jgi:hypothetical protein
VIADERLQANALRVEADADRLAEVLDAALG